MPRSVSEKIMFLSWWYERKTGNKIEVKRLQCKGQEACCVQCCIEALVCQCSIIVPTTTIHLNERFKSSESEVKRLQCKSQEACCGAMLYRSTRVSV
ncbi:hypothetical protein J6590_002994 [Homalodisca vitripennis]|nr:hypothetical protein J6590_002994 [Homalodisca vitripennis]